MTRVAVLVVLISVSATVAAFNGPPQNIFTTGPTFSTTGFLNDVNGDGLPDVVISYQYKDGVENRVWLNDGNGWSDSASSSSRVLNLTMNGRVRHVLIPPDSSSADIRAAVAGAFGLRAGMQSEIALRRVADGAHVLINQHLWRMAEEAFEVVLPMPGSSPGSSVCPPGNPNAFKPPITMMHRHAEIGLVTMCSLIDLNGDGLVDYFCSYMDDMAPNDDTQCAYLNNGKGFVLSTP